MELPSGRHFKNSSFTIYLNVWWMMCSTKVFTITKHRQYWNLPRFCRLYFKFCYYRVKSFLSIKCHPESIMGKDLDYSTSFSTTISVSYLEVIESDDEEDVFSIDALGLAGLFKLWEATWLFDFSIGIISRVCFYVLFRFAVLAFHGWFTARVVYWPKQDWRFNSNQIFMTLCECVFGVIFIWIWTSYVWPHFVFIILSWVFSLHGDKQATFFVCLCF